MRRKPDLILVLLLVFGLGVVVTLLTPMSSLRLFAEPVSASQAGVLIEAEARSEPHLAGEPDIRVP